MPVYPGCARKASRPWAVRTKRLRRKKREGAVCVPKVHLRSLYSLAKPRDLGLGENNVYGLKRQERTKCLLQKKKSPSANKVKSKVHITAGKPSRSWVARTQRLWRKEAGQSFPIHRINRLGLIFFPPQPTLSPRVYR